jgi:hypothetical protein
VFIYGFAKNDLDNIDTNDLDDLRRVARGFLEGSTDAMDRAIAEQEVVEVLDVGGEA